MGYLDLSKIGPHLRRKIQLCNDVELNPGPRQHSNNEEGNNNVTPIHDNPRVERIGIVTTKHVIMTDGLVAFLITLLLLVIVTVILGMSYLHNRR